MQAAPIIEYKRATATNLSTSGTKIDAQAVILPDKASVIVCNFAIHYFVQVLPEFMSMIRELLAPGGVIIITAFNGSQVIDALTAGNVKFGEDWVLMENDNKKYIIRRKFKSDTLENSGQVIGVKLPFSGDKLYDEYLVNRTYLTSIVYKMKPKIGMLELGSFLDVPNKLGNRQYPSAYHQLTDADKKWVGLYEYIVLMSV